MSRGGDILELFENIKHGFQDTLHLGGYDIQGEYVPKELYELSNLRELTIDGLKLTNPSQGTAKLKNLKRLELRHCSLNDLPPDFFNIKSLEILKLEDVNASNLNLTRADLTGLKSLSLRHSQLKQIPPGLFTLKTLSVLFLDNNSIEDIDWNLFPTSLKSLHIRANDILYLPEGIASLTQLRVLDLKHNHLSNLPQDIIQLKKLSSLYISYNRFETFPEQALKLIGLRYLNINHNQIRHLPLEVTALPKLKIFKYQLNPVDKDSLFKKLSLAGVYQELQNKKREKFLVGLIKIREEFTSAFQKYFVGFDRFLKETKGVYVNIFSKKVPEGVEIEIELPEMKEDLIDIVRESINDYFSLISPATIKSPDEKILELSKENLLLKLELKNTVTNFKNEIEIERTRAEIMKLNAIEFRALLEKSLSQPINLNLNNQIHQEQLQQQNQSQNLTINIKEPRESLDQLYFYLTKKKLLDDSSAKLGKDLQDYLDDQPDEVKEEELKSNNSFKNKLGRFISKTWNAMKTAKDVLKYPKDILDALNTIIKLAMAIGVSLDPEIIKQITEFIAGVK